MNANHSNRTLTLAGRVIRQIARDRRTVALFLVVPMLVLALGALLLRSEAGAVPLGVVNHDEGVDVLLVGHVSLAERIVAALEEGEGVIVVPLSAAEADEALRTGQVRGVATFPPEFSAGFAQARRATIPLRLEGSNPTDALSLKSNLTRAAIQALAGLASLSGMPAIDMHDLPITIETTYLYGGAEYDLLDFFAPVYIALIVFFFVFLLTTVSFLRERTQGTIERLLATPASRLEIAAGYMLGFMVFALAQAGLLLLFVVIVVGIHYAGSLLIVFLVLALVVVTAVNLGIFLSTFARNEFQVLQFIPLVIFPMVLLSGLIWPVADLPDILRPFAYVLPLTYANEALRDVMIKGRGLGEIAPLLGVLILFGVGMLALAAATIRREVA